MLSQNKQDVKNEQETKEEVEREGSFYFFKMPMKVVRDKKLGRADIATYRALCQFADVDTKECWPSQETIAEAARYSRKKVNECLDKLETAGYIEKIDRGRQTIVKDGRKMVVDQSLKYKLVDVKYLSDARKRINDWLTEDKISEQQHQELNEFIDRHPIPTYKELIGKINQCELTSQGGCELTSHELELGLEQEPKKSKQDIGGKPPVSGDKGKETERKPKTSSKDLSNSIKLINELANDYLDKLPVTEEELPPAKEFDKLISIVSAEWGEGLPKQEQIFLEELDDRGKVNLVKAVISKVQHLADKREWHEFLGVSSEQVENYLTYIKQVVRHKAKQGKKAGEITGTIGAEIAYREGLGDRVKEAVAGNNKETINPGGGATAEELAEKHNIKRESDKRKSNYTQEDVKELWD